MKPCVELFLSWYLREQEWWREDLESKPSSFDEECETDSLEWENRSINIGVHSCIIEKRYTIATVNTDQNLGTSRSGTMRPIDIFLSVIDNFGDVGFATELLLSFEKWAPWKYHFRLFTDNVETVSRFLENNSEYLPSYEVFSLSDAYTREQSLVIFLLFHFPIPKIRDDRSHIILRVDYLSFDSFWVKNNGKEHILSTPRIPIIEIIPSFLNTGAWLLNPFLPKVPSREAFLDTVHLPQELKHKRWIMLFAYHETFQKIDLSHISHDDIVFVLGRESIGEHPQIYTLPFQSIASFHTLLSLSDINLVRWEESALAAMILGKPFLWDMYKWYGWFSHEFSDQFLDFFDFSESYKRIHLDYNCWKNLLSIDDIVHVLQKEQCFQVQTKRHDYVSLVETLEKYIDRFYFSL